MGKLVGIVLTHSRKVNWPSCNKHLRFGMQAWWVPSCAQDYILFIDFIPDHPHSLQKESQKHSNKYNVMVIANLYHYELKYIKSNFMSLVKYCKDMKEIILI